MDIRFIASVAVITSDPAADRALSSTRSD